MLLNLTYFAFKLERKTLPTNKSGLSNSTHVICLSGVCMLTIKMTKQRNKLLASTKVLQPSKFRPNIMSHNKRPCHYTVLISGQLLSSHRIVIRVEMFTPDYYP